MPYLIQTIDDICLTSFTGVLDEKTFLAARAERRTRGFLNAFHKYVMDCSAISSFDAPFQLHRTLAQEDKTRQSQTGANVGTAKIVYISHVVDRDKHLTLYGDVRAWQNMTTGHGIVSEIHATLEEACAWLRQKKAEA
jgi:hypothetical protein